MIVLVRLLLLMFNFICFKINLFPGREWETLFCRRCLILFSLLIEKARWYTIFPHIIRMHRIIVLSNMTEGNLERLDYDSSATSSMLNWIVQLLEAEICLKHSWMFRCFKIFLKSSEQCFFHCFFLAMS